MYYLYVQSAMHKSTILKKTAEELFSGAAEKSGVLFEPGDCEQVGKEPISLVYVATGGTAGLVKAALPKLAGEIILVTSGMQNSLSASMETLTYLSQQGIRARLLHGDMDTVAASIAAAVRAAKALERMQGMRLGLIGRPSDWLISTAVDYKTLRERTGLIVEDVTMDELFDEISKAEYTDNAYCRELLEKRFDRGQIRQTLEIYGAFDRIAKRHDFKGISVRCFDLLSAVKNTGCLGLAILNALGVYAACEADLPSLVSMAILGSVSDAPVFMCNPSRADREANEIVFAHCTLPLNMPESYSLDTHFESRIGVAVSGNIPAGPVTVFKASANLSHYFLATGEIIEPLHDPNLCRTQIRMHCDVPVDEFINSHVGNHYLVCRGNFSESVELVMASLGTED